MTEFSHLSIANILQFHRDAVGEINSSTILPLYKLCNNPANTSAPCLSRSAVSMEKVRLFADFLFYRKAIDFTQNTYRKPYYFSQCNKDISSRIGRFYTVMQFPTQ